MVMFIAAPALSTEAYEQWLAHMLTCALLPE